jgi:hypothetical protein
VRLAVTVDARENRRSAAIESQVRVGAQCIGSKYVRRFVGQNTSREAQCKRTPIGASGRRIVGRLRGDGRGKGDQRKRDDRKTDGARQP